MYPYNQKTSDVATRAPNRSRSLLLQKLLMCLLLVSAHESYMMAIQTIFCQFQNVNTSNKDYIFCQPKHVMRY